MVVTWFVTRHYYRANWQPREPLTQVEAEVRNNLIGAALAALVVLVFFGFLVALVMFAPSRVGEDDQPEVTPTLASVPIGS